MLFADNTTTFSSDQCVTETSLSSACSFGLRYKIDLLFDRGSFGIVLLLHVCLSLMIYIYDLSWQNN